MTLSGQSLRSIKESRRVYYGGSNIPQTAIVCSSYTTNRFRFLTFFLKTETANNFWTVNRQINTNIPTNRHSKIA